MTRKNYRNEELHDFAARKLNENLAIGDTVYQDGMDARQKTRVDERTAKDHLYLDLRKAGKTIDEAEDTVFPNWHTAVDVATTDHFEGLAEAEKMFR